MTTGEERHRLAHLQASRLGLVLQSHDPRPGFHPQAYEKRGPPSSQEEKKGEARASQEGAYPMNGMQFWALMAMVAIAIRASHLDRTKWANLGRRPEAAQRHSRRVERVAADDEDAWLDDVAAWGDDLDGTTRVRATTDGLARANVYATVSADVAAQQAHVRGESA